MLTKKQTPQQLEHPAMDIPLNKRVFAIIDEDVYLLLSRHHWRLVRSQNCFYAARRVRRHGKEYWYKMHREIMNAPPGYEVHHKNLNTLDNRRSNLELLSPAEHRAAHNKS